MIWSTKRARGPTITKTTERLPAMGSTMATLTPKTIVTTQAKTTQKATQTQSKTPTNLLNKLNKFN